MVYSLNRSVKNFGELFHSFEPTNKSYSKPSKSSNTKQTHCLLLFFLSSVLDLYQPEFTVDAIGTSTSVVLIVAVIYWYTKDQVLTLIDLNAYVKEYNENWNDMDDISDPAGLSNQCCCHL